MKNDKTLNIGDQKFLLERFPGEESTILLFDLLNFLGESLFRFIITGVLQSEEQVENQGVMDSIMTALKSFNSAGDSKSKLELLKRILSHSRVFNEQGDKALPLNFNSCFNSGILAAFKLAREVLQFEYSDFLAASPIQKGQ